MRKLALAVICATLTLLLTGCAGNIADNNTQIVGINETRITADSDLNL